MIVLESYLPPAGSACGDCGAGTDAPCADACPTRVTLDHQKILDDLDADLDVCCPSPSYAATTLCGCGGITGAVAA